jgi:hypothetical protein
LTIVGHDDNGSNKFRFMAAFSRYKYRMHEIAFLGANIALAIRHINSMPLN